MASKTNPLADPAVWLGVSVIILVFVSVAGILYARDVVEKHLKRRRRAKKRRRGFAVGVPRWP